MSTNIYTPRDVYDFVYERDTENLRIALSQGNNSTEWYKCYCGLFAVHTAAAKCRNCLEILLDSGADIEAKTNHQSTPLIIATCNENSECVSLLLERGANIEAVDDCAGTAICAAAAYGTLDCAKLLIDHGANINVLDSRNWTPLDHCGAGEPNQQRLSLFRMLLYKGAIPGTNNCFCKYPSEFQQIVDQRKNQFARFLNTYVCYLPWKRLLKSRVFPRGEVHLTSFYLITNYLYRIKSSRSRYRMGSC
jgi:hypothetical protein